MIDDGDIKDRSKLIKTEADKFAHGGCVRNYMPDNSY